MGYPFIISYANDEFARVNHDGSWSIDWEKAINYRFEKVTPRNAAVIGMAIALMAARENFWETSWQQSNEWKERWPHQTQTLEVEDGDPEVGSIRANYGLGKTGVSAARINYDGSWSVNWPVVAELSREPLSNYKIMAVVAFCQMLMAGQYRFMTAPWDNVEVDDE